MKRALKLISLSLFLLPVNSVTVFTQQEIPYKDNPVTLSEYLSGVGKGNLGYIAEQLNVSISEASLKAAKIFPDPGINIVYSDNEDKRLKMGQTVETGINYSISLGNRRGAGIALARSKYELSQLILGSYFQNLRADAAITYYSALRDMKIYTLQKDIYDQLCALARTDSIRLQAGETTELDVMQSSLEARSRLAEVYQSLADMQNAALNLSRLMGRRLSDTLDIPTGDFPFQKRNINLSALISNATENRADLMAAIKNREVSEKNLSLLKATRALELNINAGYSYNTVSKNDIAPAPQYNSVNAGISIPLKFSNLNKGSLQAAKLEVSQSQTTYEDVELQIYTEVMQAYNNFVTQNKKVENYNLGLIDDAGKILHGRIYSYQHGETGLVDVLNAQRTYIELQLKHLEALYDYTAALIELERSTGIWDLTQ